VTSTECLWAEHVRYDRIAVGRAGQGEFSQEQK
jgi:hypothetical protein